MNSPLISVTAAILLASSVPALAQDAGAAAGVSVETPAVDAQVGVDANANAASDSGGLAEKTYGAVISSVAGSADVDLSTATEEAKITIVLLSSLQGNAEADAAALDQALTDNAESMATLRSHIEASAAVVTKLEAAGHTADDVVAVSSAADGTIIIYVDDRV